MSEMEKLTQLNQTRGSIKRRLTVFENAVEKIHNTVLNDGVLNPTHKIEIENRINKIENILDEFNIIQQDIELISNDIEKKLLNA